MKYISLVLLLAVSGMLHGQAGTGQGGVHTCTPQDTSGCISGNAAPVTLPSLTLQPSGPMTFEIGRGPGTLIITCGGSSDGKEKNCKIADGYTLDDAVNAVFETVKQSSGQTSLSYCDDLRPNDPSECIMHRVEARNHRKAEKDLERIALKSINDLSVCEWRVNTAARIVQDIQNHLNQAAKP